MAAFDVNADPIERFCRNHHVRRLALFGSAVQGTLTPESDIDVLVEFDDGHVPGMFRLIDMEAELSEIFGRKADLRTAAELSRSFRADVIRQAHPLYEAA